MMTFHFCGIKGIYHLKLQAVGYLQKPPKKQAHIVTNLCNPEPDLLEEVSWDLLRPDLGVEGSLAGPDVSLVSLDG